MTDLRRFLLRPIMEYRGLKCPENLIQKDIIIVFDFKNYSGYYKFVEFDHYSPNGNMVFGLNILNNEYGCYYNLWDKINF